MNNNQPTTESFFARMDWWLFILYALLVFVGWINIYSSEHLIEQNVLIDWSLSHGKQIINIGASLFVGLIILLTSERIHQAFGYVFYLLAIILLFITLFFGKTVHGAQGWLDLGFFQLQSAEILKLGTCLALAKFLSNYGLDMKNTREKVISFSIIVIPMLLVLLENDTGSALVFLSFVLVLFRMGLSSSYLIVPIWIGVLSLLMLIFEKNHVLIFISALSVIAFYVLRKNFKLLIFSVLCSVISFGVIFGVDFVYNNVLKDYQRDRIEILIGKKIDIKGAGYNVHQSLIAIGSGGIEGKGFLQGTQTKFNFVPEQTTDFIFCTIGEEYGFIGSFVLVLLFVLLLNRIIVIAEKQKYEFNKYYAYGIFGVILCHLVINIGMTVGLFPVIGIPLPFISYGGSSMLVFTMMIFILIKLDAENKA